MTRFADKLKSFKENVKSTFHKTKIVNKLQDGKEFVKSTFSKLVDWISEECKSSMLNIVDKAENFVKKNVQTFKNEERLEEPFKVVEEKSALNKFTVQYIMRPAGERTYDPESFF